jgi:hypothetical protein
MGVEDQSSALNHKKVIKLLETVAGDRTFININIPGIEESYRTRLLDLGGESEGCPLFVAPLEPASGNMKIRGCRDEGVVSLSFVSNNQTYQGSVTFLDVTLVNGSQLLRLSLPKKLILTKKIRRRGENRIIVPSHIDLIATVAFKGKRKIAGTIEDLSSGGLSFSCPSLAQPFTDGDGVGVVIGGSILKGESIPVSGIIRRCVVLRNGSETNELADHYGLEYKHLSSSTALALDRLVRLRIPAPDEAWFMTEKVRF